MSVQMLIRIDSEIKESLTKIARMDGKSTSQVVREIIQDYIKERDIGAYIDDLWDRIGNKLRSKGANLNDIDKKIKEVRDKSRR